VYLTLRGKRIYVYENHPYPVLPPFTGEGGRHCRTDGGSGFAGLKRETPEHNHCAGAPDKEGEALSGAIQASNAHRGGLYDRRNRFHHAAHQQFLCLEPAALAETLLRLASGKKFQGAGDDLAGFVRTQNLQQNVTGYNRIKESLTEYRSVLDTATTGGNEVYENLTRLQELSDLYENTDDEDEQTAYEKEYDEIRSNLGGMITGLTYQGQALTSTNTSADTTIKTLDLNPGSGTSNLTIALPGMMNPTGLKADLSDVGAADAIDSQMGAVQTYLAQASALSRALDSHVNIVDSIIQTNEAAQSAISDINEAEEMTTYVDQDIRSQAAIAMMAQANMERKNILTLYQ
jgi:flagellin